MALNKLLDSIFNWEDAVIIKQIAPEHYKTGFRGSICRMRTIESIEIATQFDQIINSELYLVEFADGETLEVPKCFLTLDLAPRNRPTLK